MSIILLPNDPHMLITWDIHLLDGKMKQGELAKRPEPLITDEHNHLWVTDNYVELRQVVGLVF